MFFVLLVDVHHLPTEALRYCLDGDCEHALYYTYSEEKEPGD